MMSFSDISLRNLGLRPSSQCAHYSPRRAFLYHDDQSYACGGKVYSAGSSSAATYRTSRPGTSTLVSSRESPSSLRPGSGRLTRIKYIKYYDYQKLKKTEESLLSLSSACPHEKTWLQDYVLSKPVPPPFVSMRSSPAQTSLNFARRVAKIKQKKQQPRQRTNSSRLFTGAYQFPTKLCKERRIRRTYRELSLSEANSPGPRFDEGCDPYNFVGHWSGHRRTKTVEYTKKLQPEEKSLEQVTVNLQAPEQPARISTREDTARIIMRKALFEQARSPIKTKAETNLARRRVIVLQKRPAIC